MSTFVYTEVFNSWLKRLRDQKGRARILVRLDAADLGAFGDCAFVAQGGTKSTQRRDIKRALSMRRQLDEE